MKNASCMTLALMIVGGSLLMGCSSISGNKSEAQHIGEVSRVEYGTIVSMRKIEIKPESSGTGTALGAVGGGILGSMFGGGNAKYATALGGAAIGAVAGNAIENRTQEGFEYTVKLENGSTITIAQGTTPSLSVGQKVSINRSSTGRNRIVAA